MDTNDPRIVGPTHPKKARLSLERWPLRRKVAATLVVPLVLATTFGALRIQSELSAASTLKVAARAITIVAPAVEFIDRLDRLAAPAATDGPLSERIARFDESATALTSLTRSADFDTPVTLELASAVDTAKTVRDEIAADAPPSIVLAKRMDSVASDVGSAIVTSTANVVDSAVRPVADRLTAVLAARRALTTQRILVATPDFATSVDLRTSTAEAAGAEAAAIERLYELAPDADAITLRGQSEVRRDAYTAQSGEAVTSVNFTGAVQGSAERYQALAQQLASDLEHTVAARATSLRSAALRDAAIILGAVLVALVFTLAVGSSLVRSVGRLRRGASDVARVQLPQEIEQLSKGDGVPEITALPIDTDEELGQLARAIDDIHLQAVRLASEHGVRLQIGDMFETLSRRSRSLVEEQLALIETLEHDENDPTRLDHLFRLDHLATRMRRNGDNLLVLADTVDRHRRVPPAPVSEVLRSAISEVEDYRRVSLGPNVEASIVGAASADIGHMIAELLDNALRYSPPDSPVWVTITRATDAGLLVEVADRGLGMHEDDMREANERLALGGEVTSDTAKRMGLFVVGRLARRHGATVRLRPPADNPGVTASVHLPSDLLAPTTGVVDTSTGAHPLPSDATNGSGRPESSLAAVVPSRIAATTTPTNGGLPRRSPGASGVTDAMPPVIGPPVVRPPAPPRQPVEPLWPKPEYDDGSIYAQLTNEWTAAESQPIAQESDAKVDRFTESRLPIRERGASLLPGHVDEGAEIPAETSAEVLNDPAAIRDVLSRQLTGVRRGRADTEDADRREGAR
jgi:signal transduction histidine kinase